MNKLSLKYQISAMAKEQGFDLVSFALPISKPEWREALEKYDYGDMEYMKNNIDIRSNPAKIWENVKSIIVLGLSFYNYPLNKSDANTGVFSSYSYGLDYHDYIKKMLKNFAQELQNKFGCEARVYVDTAPLMEKQIAKLSGIGWQSKNSLICSRNLGNCFFLSEILVDMDIDEITMYEHDNCCGSCQKCQKSCPTGALDSAYHVDATTCISYLTIEHKGKIPLELRKKMGNKIYGCDDCLHSCPWNKFAVVTNKDFFKPQSFLNQPLNYYLNLSEEEFRDIFRKTAIKRIGHKRFLRNVLNAIGNSNNIAWLPDVKKFIDHEDEIVRDSALWAMKELEQITLG